MSIDRIENFGRSLLQHGPENNRVYLMKLDRSDFPAILEHLNELALRNGYSKVFAKIPGYARDRFEQHGYRVEAQIPGFYNGQEEGLFMARYYHRDRLIDHAADRVQQVLETAHAKATVPPQVPSSDEFSCRLASTADCPQMADLYRQVFASYPFPIDDPAYLSGTMDENVVYAGIWQQDHLLALASAEIDKDAASAEMTDFATHPDFRGRGFAHLLLQRLEELLTEHGIKTCFTIARATSYGMNIVFAQSAYRFGGTLVKNTQISGGLESMNVWYKPLPGASA